MDPEVDEARQNALVRRAEKQAQHATLLIEQQTARQHKVDQTVLNIVFFLEFTFSKSLSRWMKNAASRS
jgi:hypothetical protein